MAVIRTLGHGTLPSGDLAELLAGAGVETVVDIRRHPGSRRHPQFNRGELARWLPEQGIDYRWEERLGGRRAPSSTSPNRGLRNAQFRAYADHMSTDELRAAVGDLLEVASSRSVAVMCAESLWWRCHRRLLSDHLVLVEGWGVEHLMADGTVTPHPVTPGARRDGRGVVYEVARDQDALFDEGG